MIEQDGYDSFERFSVESTADAAAAIREMYAHFGKQQPQEKLGAYIQRRFMYPDEGEWRDGAVGVPVLPSVLRSDSKRILIAPSYTGEGGITSRYILEPDFDYPEGILLGQTGWNTIQGKFLNHPVAYIALPDHTIIQPALMNRGTSPSFIDRDPHASQRVGEVTPELKSLLRAVQAYKT